MGFIVSGNRGHFPLAHQQEADSMGLYYQTEYRLGRRGGRVCRSYTGFRAFLAIVLDLVFGLLFELVTAVFAFAARLVVVFVQLSARFLKLMSEILLAIASALVDLVFAIARALVALLTFPFRAIRVRIKFPQGNRPEANRAAGRLATKPPWAFAREV
jgi:hypothetical protein